jgi:hypothetical protein
MQFFKVDTFLGLVAKLFSTASPWSGWIDENETGKTCLCERGFPSKSASSQNTSTKIS